jgi:two-component system OmpR family sensor kinase
VERMRIQAAAISASEPGRRLPTAGTDDEVARLGETLNEMLDRLEQALQRERRFVDEASHELRTPLANVRIELDLALRRARSSEELEAALRSAADET